MPKQFVPRGNVSQKTLDARKRLQDKLPKKPHNPFDNPVIKDYITLMTEQIEVNIKKCKSIAAETEGNDAGKFKRSTVLADKLTKLKDEVSCENYAASLKTYGILTLGFMKLIEVDQQKIQEMEKVVADGNMMTDTIPAVFVDPAACHVMKPIIADRIKSSKQWLAESLDLSLLSDNSAASAAAAGGAGASLMAELQHHESDE